MLITGTGAGGTDERQTIRDAIANFRFDTYNVADIVRIDDKGNVVTNNKGKAIYKNEPEVIDIVNEYTWTDRTLIKNGSATIGSAKGNAEKQRADGIYSKNSGNTETIKTTANLSQALRIPFAICIERKQTIASNVMNLLNLFASGVDSINLMFSNKTKDLTLKGIDGLTKFNNNHSSLEAIVNNSGIKTSNDDQR